MNAQSIWAGEMYAYTSYRPNKRFVMNALKLRAKKLEKRRQYGNDRLTTFVIGDRINEETGEVIHEDIVVRARDVIDFWDSYDNERKALRTEREEREKRWAQEREQQNQERERRLQEERELREAAQRAEAEQNERIVTLFIDKTGIPRDAIYSVGAGTIQLDRTMVELWLSNGEGHV